MEKRITKLVSTLLAIIMLVSMIPNMVFATENDNTSDIISTLINKTATPLDENYQTDVTLSVPGMNQGVGTDIVFVMGAEVGTSGNMLSYLQKTMRQLLKEFEGTGAQVKLGLVCFSDTTADETILPLKVMKDTVPGNKAEDYYIEDRYNDGSMYTESLEDYKARKAATFAAWEAANPLLVEDMEYIIAKSLEKYEDAYIGVNMESALQTAKDMLDGDTTVPAERKHLILMSTGYSWTFDDEDGNAATIVGTDYVGGYTWGQMLYIATRNRATGTTYPGKGMNVPFGWSWDTYWNYIKQWVEADGDDYVFTLGYKDENGVFVPTTYREMYNATANVNGTVVKNNVQVPGKSGSSYRYGLTIQVPEYAQAAAEKALPHFPGITGSLRPDADTSKLSQKDKTTVENMNHAINYERSMYDSYKIFEELREEGTHCYAVTTYMYGNRYISNATTKYFGDCFMDMMAGGTAPKYSSSDEGAYFDPIHKEILYSCAAGSTVVDYIGKNENGNFEFIQNPEYVSLTVGGVKYITEKVATKEGYDFSLAFKAKADAEPTFWMDYVYGDGKTTERFVWTFGEAVSLERKASLTYKLQLTDKQEDEGTYTIPTNNSAILYPKDSNGNDVTPQIFTVPEVEYTVVPYDVDIVIALGAGIAQYDKDHGYTHTYDSIVNLVKPLVEGGINVKLGLIAVEHYDDVAMELTVLAKDNYKDLIQEGLEIIQNMPAGPTNLEGNILAAKAMLDADTAVPAQNKYFYVISTGRTYNYDNEQGVPTTIINQVALKGQSYYYWGHYLWQSQRGGHTSLYMIPARYNNDFNAYWADVCKWVAADGDKYAYSFTDAYDPTNPDWYVGTDGFYTNNTKDAKAMGLASSRFGWILKDLTNSGLAAISSGSNPQNALNYERAQYEAYQAYQAMKDAGYTCEAICSESANYQNGSEYIKQGAKYTGTSTIQLGHSFMIFLNDGVDKTLFDYTRDEKGNMVSTAAIFEITDYFTKVDTDKLVKTEKPIDKGPIMMSPRPPKAPIVITQQPVDAQAALGETISTTVVATGEGLKYQWYIRNVGTTTFSKSSITSATYSTTMTTARANREAYCVITDAKGNTVSTDIVKLTRVASTELKILEQPTDASAALNKTVSTTVKAQGEGLKYQWYIRNAGSATFSKSSTTSATYITTMNATRAGRQIYCVITDALGNTVTSDIVTLTCDIAELKILEQPTDASAALNKTVSTTVKVQGEGLKYQWYIRNAGSTTFSKSSTTSATYITTMNATRAGRQIYCVITDALGNTVSTDIVSLTLS